MLKGLYRAAAVFTVPISLLIAAGCSGSGNGADMKPELERAFPGLTFQNPVAMTQAPGDAGRWFLLEKGGNVWMFDNDNTTDSRILSLNLSAHLDTSGEGGLLGISFHPSFLSNREVFLYYTGPGGPGFALTSIVSRFRVQASGVIDPASEEVILTLDQPFPNHNGGTIAFGPDGYLYVGLGDGGGSGDPLGNGQDTETLHGAMLRLDVNGDMPYVIPADNVFAGSSTDRQEIYAWGFRNPWKFSFDAVTGELWLGDVGQNSREEIDRVRAGENYGWNIREGSSCFAVDPCDQPGLTDPVTEYDHSLGRSVTGGYVYRGSAMPALYGHYLYGDFVSGSIWGFDVGRDPAVPSLLMDTSLRIVSFAEDSDRELYVLDYSGGGVYRLLGL